MAYDRFVAICHPLHYLVIMNPHLCGFSVFVSFLLSVLDSQLHNLLILQITNFKNVEISSFFCDSSLLLNLSCTDTYSNNIDKYFLAAVYGLFPISGILFSYYKIMSSLLRIPSLSGKFKAFSTCGSHLAGVCLFLGTGTAVYLGSAASHSPRKDVVDSVMYTVVTPMLNPFIYSLRNRDIKRALRRLQRCLRLIEVQNLTCIPEFHPIDRSVDLDLQPIFFGLFLSMYLVTVLGNLLIILAVSSDSHLHTSMNFFLSNLSLTDICFISTTIPKLLVNIQTHKEVVSDVG
ncbi:olfactory receptor 7E178-like [Marmota monax]|uniref:olfactory receptor 7E178-like n=1 Tax=Marmota monax TaxID=9995 RepID=UPI001EB0841B|nr:olfactory receptor 7E178-like [Marmota monax]